MARKKMSFEQALSRLEDIVELMENPETDMEGLVNNYKEAIGLAVFLNEALAGYEQQVMELTKTAEKITEKNFESEQAYG